MSMATICRSRIAMLGRLVDEQVLDLRVDVCELFLRGDVIHRTHIEYDIAINV